VSSKNNLGTRTRFPTWLVFSAAVSVVASTNENDLLMCAANIITVLLMVQPLVA